MADELKDARRKKRAESNRAYYLKNAEKLKAIERDRFRVRYEEDAEFREQIQAKNSAWREANGERAKASRKQRYEAEKAKVSVQSKAWYEANKASRLAKCAEWRKANPAKVLSACRGYQTAKRGAVPAWSRTEFEAFAIGEAYALAALRSNVLGVPHEVDHIVPLRGRNVSGLHCLANLRVILKSVNVAKGNRHWPDMP